STPALRRSLRFNIFASWDCKNDTPGGPRFAIPGRASGRCSASDSDGGKRVVASPSPAREGRGSRGLDRDARAVEQGEREAGEALAVAGLLVLQHADRDALAQAQRLERVAPPVHAGHIARRGDV